MASILGDTTCVTHPDRSAVARCPSCEQFFCAECITEHEGKMICAKCLAMIPEASPEKKERRFPIASVLQCFVALAFVFLLFYFFAQTLGDIPDDFHDGTIWE